MKKLSVCLLSIFILLTFSCEIGLGASVDTEAPTLEIANPPSDAVIRDDFAIQGSWTDDGTLASVSVEMVRLENGQKSSFTGTFTSTSDKNTSGNWSIVITPKDSGLLDGTYEAVVAISDNGGHTTTMARSFTIDNTPPVMLLSRPSVKFNESGSDNYGRSFTLEGKAADDSGVSLIEMNVYDLADTSGIPLKTVELKNIPLTIEQDVAVFASENEVMKNNYAAIYGHTDENGNIRPDEMNHSEQRYCTIKIYDDAQRYPADGSSQSEGDKKGNSTNTYYMDTDIATLFQGKYKITDFYNMLNGSYGFKSGRGASASDEVKNVKELLHGVEVSSNKFSINPSNNPTYIVTSAVKKAAGKRLNDIDYQFTTGNRYLEIEVTPGLDGYPILPDTIGVYLQECDIDGNLKEDEPRICLIGKGAENHLIEVPDNYAPTPESKAGVVTVSGKTYKFKTSKTIDKNNYFEDNPADPENPFRVKIGSYYAVIVEGNDSQGVENGKIVSDGLYAFQLVSSGEMIELKGQGKPDFISTVENVWKPEGQPEKNFVVTLEWKGGEAPYDIYRVGKDEKIVTVSEQTEVAGELKWQATESFTYDQLHALAPAGRTFPESISYQIRRGGDLASTTAEIRINTDSVAPTITLNQISPSYYKDNVYYVRNVSGNACTIQGIATDDTGIQSVQLIDTGLPDIESTDNRFTFANVDFSQLSETTKEVNAKIVATDVAGNRSELPVTIKFDTTAPAGIHEIDALGKDLYFRVGEGNGGAGSKYSKDSYGNSSTIKIHGKFDDTKYVINKDNPETFALADSANSSGVKMIYYKVFDAEPDEDDLSNFEANYDKNDSPDKADGYFMPLETPKPYTVPKNVRNEQTGALESKPKEIITTYEATISGFEHTANYLALVAVDNVGNAALERVKVKTGVDGEGNDVFAISGIYVMNNDTEVPTITSGKKFEDTQYVNSTATENLVIYGIAEDTAAGIDSITVKVNGLEIPATGSTPEVNGTIKFYKGDVSNETNDQDQVTKTIITYTEDDTEKTEEISTEYKDITSFTDNKLYWKLEIKPSVFNDVTSGNVSVYATVKDKAGTGNSQTVTIATVNVDKDAPTAEIRTPCKAEDSGVHINKKIEVSGIASDKKNQIKEVLGLYYKEGSVITPVTDVSDWTRIGVDPDGTNNWSFKNVNTESLPSGALSLTVAVKDMAGNIGYAAPINVTVDQDSDRPVLTLSQIGEKTAENTTTLKTKNVYGSIKDDDGTVKKFWYWSKQVKESVPTEAPSDTEDNGWTPVVVNGNSWSIDSTEEDGETTWYFAIEDAEGSIFWTCAKKENGDNDPLAQPYILYKGESTKKNNTAGVTFKYDTNPPVATHLYLYRAETTDTRTLAQVKDDSAIAWSEENEIAFGGNYQKLFAKITVTESTEMKKLEGSTGSEPTSSPVTISYKNAAGKSFNYEQINQVHEEGSNEYTYYLGPLVMDTTEKTVFNVTVEDASQNKGYISRDIIVDNTAPTEITGVKPKKGSPETGVVNFRGGVNDNKNGSGLLYKLDDSGNLSEYGLQYYIPKYSEKDTDPENIAASNWLPPTTPGSSSWEIEFANLGADIGYNGSTYEVSSDFSGYETSTGSGLYDIPVWFRLTDMVGNVGYNTANAITYNPNADRPTIDFTYPVHDKTLENGLSYVIMGGTITISGMATDDDGISAVYLQFDTNGDGNYDNTGFTTETIEHINQTITAVKATGTKSWYYTMSLSRFEGLNAQEDGKTLNIRAIAIEKDDEKLDAGEKLLYSAWTKNPLHISVNNNVPNFSTPKLKRFGTAPTAETLSTAVALAEQTYTSGMYINGGEDWYLVGDAEVTSGNLARITLSGKDINGLSYTAVTNDTDTLIAKKKDVEQGDAITFAIPIQLKNGATTGSWSAELYVEDDTAGSPRNNKNQLVINLDSDAPDFADKNADNTIKLYKNAYGSAGTELNKIDSDKFVQNSNGAVFTFAGKITEGGSGFERLVFYYKRKNSSGGDVRIYNPMEAHGADNTANRVDIGGAVSFNSEELPVLSLTGVTRETEVTVKDSAISGNANIRKGGLVKIGGVYRIIEDVSSDTVTFSPSCSTSYTDVEFVYGMVVDHNGESEKSDGSIKNDDGDGMLESFTKAGSSYTWDATINSKNIPDGPIEIHCVVFDAAGNSRHGYTETKVSNNPPRLTSLKLGTDLNSDGKYALDSEFQTYYANLKDDGSGNTKTGVDVWNLNTSTYGGETKPYWIAKKDLVLITEFVGGSGTIYYRYDKTAGESAADLTSANTGSLSEATPTLAALLNSHEKIVSNLTSTTAATLSVSQTDNRIGAIILENDEADGLGKLGYTAGEDGVNLYTFSFWDSTEECTVGSDTQWAVLNLRFKQDLIDNTAPTGSITPFYWYSKNNNSLVYDDKGNALGHIELPSDLPDSFVTGAEDKELDRDPKVSGRIKIEGSAFDETLLGSITLSFGGKAVTAEYKKETKLWTYTGNSADFTLAVTDTYGPLQTGHSVTWTYFVDSSKIEDIAKNDVAINLTITDASSAVSGGNSKTVAPYQVDVVPYITGITTAFSAKLKSSIRDAYSRTTLGHYIARADETITIKGFNISSTGEVELDVSTLESGPYVITVNGVKTLNNLNDNNACGAYESGITEGSLYSDKATYAYNRMPNRTSNNLLTDDVYIDIWQFDSNAAIPKSGELREPSMKINPVTGEIGLAFVDGPAHFAMAGTVDDTSYSYAEWQRNYATYSNVNFTYDSLGYAHATATGLDTNPNTHHAGRFTYFYNKWGTSGLDTQDGNYNGANAIRLEAIAVPYMTVTPAAEVFNGTTYATIRHKVLANGTFIETADGALTENRFYSPSLVATVHGTGDTASTAVYLAYYDSVQKQIRFRYSSEVPKDKKGNKNDFVDNSGYKQNGDTGSYMEAYTSNFSLIAGVDTQQGEDHFTPVAGSQKVNLQKTDSDGVPLFKMTDYRNAKLNADGSLTDTKNKGYTIAEFTMDATIFGSLQDALKARFTVGQKYNWIQNGNFRWIIQDDGLIYYTTEENPAKGYMTMVPCSTYQAHEKSVKVKDNPLRKLDPDENYIVYEKVGIADSSINEGNDKNKVGTVIEGYKYKFYQQPNYYWPYSSGTPATYLSEELPNAVVYSTYDTGYTAYKYVAIDAIAGSDAAHDKVVAVWYDGTNCCYAYNDNPTSGKDNGSEVTIDGVTYGGGWKNNRVIFSEGGEHCTVKLDSAGGVHIAAYVDGSLRYAYLPKVDAAYNEATDSVKVDSFTITGERITLDVGKDSNGKVIPYISYFNGTARLPCVANLVVPAGSTPDYKAQGTGTDDGEDMFTGNWEISLVPSPKTLTTNYYDKMNICLWKQGGSIVPGNDTRFTVTGGAAGKTSAANSSGTTSGNIYGNGTANPILGYAIESTSGTCLETAQMQ